MTSAAVLDDAELVIPMLAINRLRSGMREAAAAKTELVVVSTNDLRLALQELARLKKDVADHLAREASENSLDEPYG